MRPARGNLTLIGRGVTSDVFSWRDGMVVKLFHAGTDISRIMQEFDVTNAIHHAGFAAPAVHEIIEHEKRNGIVMERIEGPSLLDANQSKPWRMWSAVRQLARMHADLHGYPAPAFLPQQRQLLAERIAAIPWKTSEDRVVAERLLSTLPDGESICHGDFHPGNVILSSQGPIVIDWSTASRGSPLGDVARTSLLFDNAEIPTTVPMFGRHFFGIFRQWFHRVYLYEYFRVRPGSRKEIQQWRSVISLPPKARPRRRLVFV
jgi:uncharacterized protein (TIGR02172 family)